MKCLFQVAEVCDMWSSLSQYDDVMFSQVLTLDLTEYPEEEEQDTEKPSYGSLFQ